MAGNKTLAEILDGMALKIMMIEPGDLSVVGELVSLVEDLGVAADKAQARLINRMARAYEDTLGRIIMGDCADSGANFDLLGKCIGQMQEVLRKEGQADEAEIEQFCGHLKAIGYEVDKSRLLNGDVQPETPPPAVSAPAAPVDGKAGGAPPLPDFLQDTELLGGFVEEAFEHLESIEANILELEQDPDNKDIINNIFRPFHTIKGVSGFLNLTAINKLAHATENLLDDVRNDRRSMDADVIDVVLSVGDYLRSMVGNIKEVLQSGPDHYRVFDISGYMAQVERVQKGGAGGAPPAKPAEVVFEPAPPPALEDNEAQDGADSEPLPPPPLNGVAEGGLPGSSPLGKVPPPAVAKKVGATIKVDVEKLDGMVNAVGELVIMQVMVRQNPLVAAIADPKLTRDLSQLARITTELQRTAMSMRMVPIRQTFQKMTRLVRDLSKKTGKDVDLNMYGEETEIDRNMVDSIYDPLVHMVRNSVDHGVQTAAERQRVGKPAKGVVELRAYQKGSSIIIEIEDDGQGLNTKKIRQKAIERGLIPPDSEMSDHEINNLIFLPGFSTADKITDVSGRGVGMDVVKKAVEKMRGKVEVVSEPGKGSQFLIRLPLTLAIIDGIVVRVGEERYIIPTIAIQESIRPGRAQYNTVHGHGETLLIREKLIPIIRLYEVFQVKATHTDPCEGIVVVVENEGRRRALMVDELLGKQEVVIKSLGGYMKNIPGVAGGTILGDGRVGLILDLAGLIAANETRS